MCTAIAADFCNGVSTLLDFNARPFVNRDLTISLARLGKGKGYYSRAVQSIVLGRR
jgi:5-formyltetrahydrofolate cyclo-ligase